jgi:hypothetical protein
MTHPINNLPPLPKATIYDREATGLELLFCDPTGHTDEAMQAYARKHAAALAECVKELEGDLDWHRKSLTAHAGKLAAVWEGIREAVQKFSGKPCEGEPFDRLDELLTALAAARQPVEAEPVAWRRRVLSPAGTIIWVDCGPSDQGAQALYLAAPQPATVDRDAVLEEAARICDAIESDKWALYKGREPYKGNEPGRADPHVQGESDGAGQCASRIRAALSQQERKEGGGE